jgi:hypothetical protein
LILFLGFLFFQAMMWFVRELDLVTVATRWLTLKLDREKRAPAR